MHKYISEANTRGCRCEQKSAFDLKIQKTFRTFHADRGRWRCLRDESISISETKAAQRKIACQNSHEAQAGTHAVNIYSIHKLLCFHTPVLSLRSTRA